APRPDAPAAPVAVVRGRQPAQGRGDERGADRGSAAGLSRAQSARLGPAALPRSSGASTMPRCSEHRPSEPFWCSDPRREMSSTRDEYPCMTALAVLALGSACAVPSEQPGTESSAPDRGVRMNYRVRYVPEEDAARWDVRLDVRGVDPAAGPVSFQLGDWGEWMELDSLLLRGLGGDPPVRRDEKNATLLWLEAPSNWTGAAELHYSITLTRGDSQARQRVGLWPFQGAGFAHGFTANTLANVEQNGEELAGSITVEFLAPAGMTLDTGWTGRATTSGRVALTHPLDNTA